MRPPTLVALLLAIPSTVALVAFAACAAAVWLALVAARKVART